MEDNQKDILKDSKNQLTVGYFYSYFNHLYKKTDKIATAVFMVTDNMSDIDDLKKSIRQSSLELMSLTKTGSFKKDIDRLSVLQDILLHFHKLRSLVELSGTMDYISQMNAGILVKEISQTIYSVETKKEEYSSTLGYKISPSFVLEASIFDVEETIPLDRAEFSKGHLSFRKLSSDKQVNLYNKRQIEPFIYSKNNQNNDSKKSRRLQILNLIKDKKYVTIKDISLMVKNCSEKTIQRELADMVLEGVLDRKGERRWSTYNLKNTQ